MRQDRLTRRARKAAKLAAHWRQWRKQRAERRRGRGQLAPSLNQRQWLMTELTEEEDTCTE